MCATLFVKCDPPSLRTDSFCLHYTEKTVAPVSRGSRPQTISPCSSIKTKPSMTAAPPKGFDRHVSTSKYKGLDMTWGKLISFWGQRIVYRSGLAGTQRRMSCSNRHPLKGGNLQHLFLSLYMTEHMPHLIYLFDNSSNYLVLTTYLKQKMSTKWNASCPSGKFNNRVMNNLRRQNPCKKS